MDPTAGRGRTDTQRQRSNEHSAGSNEQRSPTRWLSARRGRLIRASGIGRDFVAQPKVQRTWPGSAEVGRGHPARYRRGVVPTLTRRERSLVLAAMTALRQPAVSVGHLSAEQTGHPGLYAFYASPTTWRQLGLGEPPDARPIYVGKAERTLASRDVEGHFGLRERGVQSPTGSSTLRCSLAALLASRRGYRGIPRNPAKPGYFSNFGLSEAHDEDLSTWMKKTLSLALWPHVVVAELDTIETHVLGRLQPPFNLNKVKTPWRGQIKFARKLLAAQARAWKE
jgi:hypothetical protein